MKSGPPPGGPYLLVRANGVDGTRYASVLLRTDVEGTSRVIGIAMLTGLDDAQRAALLPLAGALAKILVESGDFLPA
jgi:hypothetical protein